LVGEILEEERLWNLNKVLSVELIFDSKPSLLQNKFWKMLSLSSSGNQVRKSWEAVGNFVVIPSISFPPYELRTVTGASHFEERQLYYLLGLTGKQNSSLIFLSSLPIDPFIVSYYLSLNPAANPSHVQFFSMNDASELSLAQKIYNHPRMIARLRELIRSRSHGILMVNMGEEYECRLQKALDIPMYSATMEQKYW
jgi:hypothetical protein